MNAKEKNHELFVEGKIIISASVHQFEKGVAHISLVDTTYQDVEGIALAETKIFGIRHKSNETVLDFRLEIAEMQRFNPNNDYGIQVWIDTNGNENPEAEDLFKNQSHRVLTRGFGNTLTIKFDGD